jgi:hypothetical protein
MSDVVEGYIITYETVYGSAGAHSRTTPTSPAQSHGPTHKLRCLCAAVTALKS